MFKQAFCSLFLTTLCFAADSSTQYPSATRNKLGQRINADVQALPIKQQKVYLAKIVENEFSATLLEESMAWKLSPEQRYEILMAGEIFFSADDDKSVLEEIFYALGLHTPDSIKDLANKYKNKEIAKLSLPERLNLIYDLG